MTNPTATMPPTPRAQQVYVVSWKTANGTVNRRKFFVRAYAAAFANRLRQYGKVGVTIHTADLGNWRTTPTS